MLAYVNYTRSTDVRPKNIDFQPSWPRLSSRLLSDVEISLRGRVPFFKTGACSSLSSPAFSPILASPTISMFPRKIESFVVFFIHSFFCIVVLLFTLCFPNMTCHPIDHSLFRVDRQARAGNSGRVLQSIPIYVIDSLSVWKRREIWNL